MALLTIHGVEEFRDGNGIDDVIALGIGPLQELADTIEFFTDPANFDSDGEINGEKIGLLTRLMSQGLKDMEAALNRIVASYREERKPKAA